MTTVVVTKKSGIACIAADTLATYGDMRESADLIANSDKLVRIGDAWVAPTGPASAQLVLKHFISTYDELPCLEDTDGIFDFLNVLQRALRDEYFVHGKEDSTDDFESMRMELLIASPGGLFGAYPQRSVQEYTRAFGSGPSTPWAPCTRHGTPRSAPKNSPASASRRQRPSTRGRAPLTLRTIPLEEREVQAGLFAEQVAPRRPPVATSPAASPAARLGLRRGDDRP